MAILHYYYFLLVHTFLRHIHNLSRSFYLNHNLNHNLGLSIFFFIHSNTRIDKKMMSTMIHHFFFFFFSIIFISVFSSSVFASVHHDQDHDNNIIRFLPGFPGPLPFHFETGYIGVGSGEKKDDDVQLFYYFIKSESRNSKSDPVLLWLTGGPGCSGFSALVLEIGPLKFNVVEYNGSLPTLRLNPYSWTKAANIIFLDSPVGTGFSYSRSPEGLKTGTFKTGHQTYQFLRKWLIDHHPEFISNPFYIGGDSYSGMTVPLIVKMISDGIDAGNEPSINLKGLLVGNAATVPHLEENSKIPFFHRMGLLSDELYESLKKSCAGEYKDVDPSNILCKQNLDAYSKCISGINQAYILDPSCAFSSPRPRNPKPYRRSLSDQYREFLDPTPLLLLGTPPDSRGLECRSYAYLLSYYWMNDESVRKALHIREGSVPEWQRCNHDLSYQRDFSSSFPYHVILSQRGYRSLVYSGDHDALIPHIGTQAWIRLLNYSIVDDWRSWSVDGQVGGYTRTYSNNMTFATVKGGGHTAPEYRPKECLAMFKRWIFNEFL